MVAKREQQRIVAYLDGLPPIGVTRARQAKVDALPALHLSRRSLPGCSLGRLQSPPSHFGDGSQSALTSSLAKHPERASVASGMPSILRPQGGAFKGEL
jgi:hypothetical protein